METQTQTQTQTQRGPLYATEPRMSTQKHLGHQAPSRNTVRANRGGIPVLASPFGGAAAAKTIRTANRLSGVSSERRRRRGSITPHTNCSYQVRSRYVRRSLAENPHAPVTWRIGAERSPRRGSLRTSALTTRTQHPPSLPQDARKQAAPNEKPRAPRNLGTREPRRSTPRQA